MILFLGDIHGDFSFFKKLEGFVSDVYADAPVTIIQVGDFGYWPDRMKFWPTSFPYLTYFIDGNHEYFPHLKYDEPTYVRDNLVYIPRGTVMEMYGYTIGFLGGGFSPDKRMRTEGLNWFSEEEVSQIDIEKFVDVEVDLMVTHTPPISVAIETVGPLNKAQWGLLPDDEDYSARRMQILWQMMNYVPMICGHMHLSYVRPNMRILNINELYGLVPKNEQPDGKIDLTRQFQL